MSNLPILQKRDRNLSISIFSENITDRNTYSDEMLPFANLITQSYNMLNNYISQQKQKNYSSKTSKPAQGWAAEDDDIPF